VQKIEKDGNAVFKVLNHIGNVSVKALECPEVMDPGSCYSVNPTLDQGGSNGDDRNSSSDDDTRQGRGGQGQQHLLEAEGGADVSQEFGAERHECTVDQIAGIFCQKGEY
jgi:hypothetical protein